MKVLLLFALISMALTGVAMVACSFLEGISSHVSLLAFLGLFMGQFILAWIAAVWLTERYLVSDREKEDNQRHVDDMQAMFRKLGV